MQRTSKSTKSAVKTVQPAASQPAKKNRPKPPAEPTATPESKTGKPAKSVAKAVKPAPEPAKPAKKTPAVSKTPAVPDSPAPVKTRKPATVPDPPKRTAKVTPPVYSKSETAAKKTTVPKKQPAAPLKPATKKASKPAAATVTPKTAKVSKPPVAAVNPKTTEARRKNEPPVKPLKNDRGAPNKAEKKARTAEKPVEKPKPPVAAKPPVKKKVKPLGSAVVRGKNGRYDFEVFPLDAELKDGSAIYVISKRMTDKQGRGHHKFVCIGETESLLGALKTHRKGKCIKQHDANVVCLLREENELDRRRIETDLREAHRISCNQQ